MNFPGEGIFYREYSICCLSKKILTPKSRTQLEAGRSPLFSAFDSRVLRPLRRSSREKVRDLCDWTGGLDTGFGGARWKLPERKGESDQSTGDRLHILCGNQSLGEASWYSYQRSFVVICILPIESRPLGLFEPRVDRRVCQIRFGVRTPQRCDVDVTGPGRTTFPQSQPLNTTDLL